MGVVKVSLIALLPVILLAMSKPQVVTSTQTIEVPRNFCELDNREACSPGKCIRYDPKKFQTTPSIVTYFPGGRLGNMLTAYLFLLWIKLEHGYDTYFEKESYKYMEYFFANLNGTVKILEEDLCDWTQFGFKKFEGNIETLSADYWKTGHAIQIYIGRENYLRSEIQGGRKFYKKYRKECMHALSFKPLFARHAQITLENIAKKVGKKPKDLTYVAVHNRRTDFLEFRRKTLKMDNLYEDYFEDAMDYFRDEYGDDVEADNVVFVYASDDMKWGRRRLKKQKNLFFVGCGDGNDLDCIGKDLALMGACNHTITTHGTFGHWSSYFAGGDIYTEYGAIVPDATV